jgi:hypothetical protein
VVETKPPLLFPSSGIPLCVRGKISRLARGRQRRRERALGRRLPRIGVLVRLGGPVGRQTSSWLPPKDADPGPCGFSPCKPVVFRGPREGAIIGILDPLVRRRRMVGEGHAPVVAVLLAAAKTQTSPSRTPKDVNHGHPSLFACKRDASWGARRGPSMAIADPSGWQPLRR